MKNPPGGGPGDSSPMKEISNLALGVQIESARFEVRQEGGKSGTGDEGRAPLRALAVPDPDHRAEVDSPLRAAAVVLAAAGLPPYCLRQVGHGCSSCCASCL